MAAESRTERVTTCSHTRPPNRSPYWGASELRPRVGFSPTRPQHEAGIRMEPPPSPPWAAGTMPDATAAADPPEEPPVECSVFHGLREAPKRRGSVVGRMPSSGVLVFPHTTNPACTYRRVSSWVTVEV